MTINRKTNTQDKMFTAKTKEELETLYKELQAKGWELDEGEHTKGQFNGGFGQFYMCLHRSVPEDFQDPTDPYEIPLEDDDEEEEDSETSCYCPICGEKTDLTQDRFCKHLKFYLFDGSIEVMGKISKKLDKWLDTHELDGFDFFEENKKNLNYLLDKFKLEKETISWSGLCCGPVSFTMHFFYGK